VESRPNNMLEDVLRQIGQHERFVLTSHARPDGDAIGSALACCQVLREMGKQADVVLHDGVPRIYRSLPFADQVLQSSRVTGSYEAAIILECDSIHRTRLEGLEDRVLISIDHHVSGRPFAHVNWIDPHAVATAEMVFRLARHAGAKFSPEIATCLYTALMMIPDRSCSRERTTIHSLWPANSYSQEPIRHTARAEFTSRIPSPRSGCSAKPCAILTSRATLAMLG